MDWNPCRRLFLSSDLSLSLYAARNQASKKNLHSDSTIHLHSPMVHHLLYEVCLFCLYLGHAKGSGSMDPPALSLPTSSSVISLSETGQKVSLSFIPPPPPPINPHPGIQTPPVTSYLGHANGRSGQTTLAPTPTRYINSTAGTSYLGHVKSRSGQTTLSPHPDVQQVEKRHTFQNQTTCLLWRW